MGMSGGGARLCTIIICPLAALVMGSIILMVGWLLLNDDMATVSLVARGIIMGDSVPPIPGGRGVA